MSRRYFVLPETTRLWEDAGSDELRFVKEPAQRGPAWIEVKNRLNYAETLGAMGALLGGDVPVSVLDGDLSGVRVALKQANLDMLRTWLVDWSFPFEHDEQPVPYSPDAVESLDPEVAEAIRNAISTHLAALSVGKAPTRPGRKPAARSG